MDFTFLLVAFVFLSIYLFFTRNYSYWKNQNVPYAPYAIPGIGHTLSLCLFWNNLPMWANKLYKKMGKCSMYGCYFMQTPALLIRDPELVKSVLQTNFMSFRNNMITLNKDLDPILTKTPVFSKDEVWKESRVILGNNFSGKTLRGLHTIVLKVCEKFTNFVDKHICENSGISEFELKDLCARITGEIVANAAFGMEGQSFHSCPDYQAFTNIAKRLFDTTKISGIEQAIRFCTPKLADRLGLSVIPKETDRYFRENIRSIIKWRLQYGETRTDFLHYIIERMNKEIDEDMVLRQVTSIFMDGYETSSTVLSFIIYRLAENPNIQDKAREEVSSVLKRFNNELTYEAIKSMNYLEQIMYEAIRLNPVFGEFIRVCNEPITLHGYDKLSCNLQPGDLVLISAIGLHLDEEFWQNPSVFDPERFNVINKIERNKFTYLGFGEGSRMCIGKRMAIMTVKAVTAIILKHYILEPSFKTKVPLQMSPNTFSWIVKGGLWARLKPLHLNE